MKIQSLHPNFIMPTKSHPNSAGFDLYMPEAGFIDALEVNRVGLGFAAAIPEGYVGLLLPRSGVGSKNGLEINNTCGVIDSNYRGEWIAALTLKSGKQFSWAMGDRLLQVLIVPVPSIELTLVEQLDSTDRGTGGFGSTGI